MHSARDRDVLSAGRLWLGGAVAAMAIMVAPAGASAATVFGADMIQTPVLSPCANEITGDVKTQAGDPVTGTPVSGVLTAVMIKTQGAGGAGVIRVVRQIGDPQPPGNYDFLNVGPDIPVTVTEDLSAEGHFTEVATRQPIAAGDRLSIWFSDNGGCTINTAWDDGGTTPVCASLPSVVLPGPAGHIPGNIQTFAGSACNSPQLLSGTVEPDCDGDGFGDETQDTNGAVCTPPTPPAATPTPTPKKKKCKKAKKKGKAAAAAKKKKCKKKGKRK